MQEVLRGRREHASRAWGMSDGVGWILDWWVGSQRRVRCTLKTCSVTAKQRQLANSLAATAAGDSDCDERHVIDDVTGVRGAGGRGR